MILYLAGSLTPEKLTKLGDMAGARNFLETYAHKDARECATFLAQNRPDMRLFVDSGAFTAWTKGTPINLGEYIAFCKNMISIAKCPLVFASLDVIAGRMPKFDDPVRVAKMLADGGVDYITPGEREKACEQGWDNYLTMKQEGVDSIPTFHQGERKYWLKKISSNVPYMALSHRKRGVNSEGKKKWFRWCFDYLGRSIKTHGLGVSSANFMEEFPFYSVDSTAWLQGGRAGAYRYFNGIRAPLLAPSDWRYNLDVSIPAVDRYRPPGQTDPTGETGIYFFAMRAMQADVFLEEYITRHWQARGVNWE